MERRIELHRVLSEIMSPNKVYFQPPNALEMSYPCIVYALDMVDEVFADNLKHVSFRRYSLTLIDEDPDSKYVDSILELTMSSFDRFYTVDDLNHFTFTIYF